MAHSRCILHIEAGGENWDPTAEELGALIDVFNTVASTQENHDKPEIINSVIEAVATRQDIKVTVLELDENDATFVTSDPETMRKAVSVRLFNEFLSKTTAFEGAPTTDYVSGYYEGLSQVRSMIQEIVGEIITK